jgi:VWFA-related protein
MNSRSALALAFVAIAVCALAAASQTPPPQQQQQQPPRFQSSVEVTPVDVTVVDGHGQPIRDLAPSDFTVRIDGNQRRVVSAEWISLVTAANHAAPAVVPEGFTSNENATGGRLIVIAVDEPNIRFGAARGVAAAAGAFIDRLSPSDRVAAVGLALNSPATPFTADRERVKKTIARMNGQQQQQHISAVRQYNIALSEAIQISNGDMFTFDTVVTRECRNETSPAAQQACRNFVQSEALEIARDAQHDSLQTTRALRDLLIGLARIDAPKTLILMSEGFVMDGSSAEVIELGALAARARTSLYTLLLEEELYSATEARITVAPLADRLQRTEGLETLAGASRGTLFRIAGTGAAIFQRIESELSGYYLLGVEPDSRDRDGKPHPVRVDVPRRGAIVRARRQIVNVTGADARPPSGREAVASALVSPLIMSALPLRVATFSLQGPDPSKIQVLIHADVGADYSGSKRMSVGYTIADQNGRLIDSQGSDLRLSPMVTGVPSPLEYAIGASLPPGDYTLKLAAADGERTGSIEHPIHAALLDTGRVKLSELMVGGPADPEAALRPTIGYAVAYGSLHGYLEAYGADAPSVQVKYEVATNDSEPAILTADVKPRQAGDGRAVFSRVLQVRALPAGKYVLRAIITAAGQPLKTLTRAFEVSSPAVLMTSATGLGDEAPSSDGELFLPIEEHSLDAPFRTADALKDATLEPFRSRLAPAAKPSFDKGLAQLAAGDYVHAETSFKAAIQPDTDSTAALAYLAVCFAASGHDDAAASAWQTALVDGGDVAQIYQWLGEALLRTHSLAEARSVLEEAAGRWPSDVRFTRPLAFVYASFGKGREAVRTLERFIGGGGSPDPDIFALGVEWIYQIHAAGGVVHNRGEDLKLARGYAERYSRGGGAKQQLVKQWMDFLEKEKR